MNIMICMTICTYKLLLSVLYNLNSFTQTLKFHLKILKISSTILLWDRLNYPLRKYIHEFFVFFHREQLSQ